MIRPHLFSAERRPHCREHLTRSGEHGYGEVFALLGFSLYAWECSFIVDYVDMKDSFLGHKSFNFLDYLSIVNCRYVGRYFQKEYFYQALMLALF